MHTLLVLSALLLTWIPVAQDARQPPTSPTAVAAMDPTLLAAEQVGKLLPSSVFFRGQTAPLQIRNAAAARFSDGAILFASLVDTSGYSTSVRERYQFYLVTEAPLSIGDKMLPSGAYGAGFLEDGAFVIMDIGGHDVLLAHTTRDDAMHRPRPLQMVAGDRPESVRLYLGRSFVLLARAPR